MTRTHLIIIAAVLAVVLLAHFLFHVSLFTILGLLAIAAVFTFIYLGWRKSRRAKP